MNKNLARHPPVVSPQVEIPEWRKHFDVVVACEDEEGEDLDVPLISIKFR